MEKEITLVLNDVTMRYKGVLAVDKLNVTLEKGKIYGLIGTNGAGKSTVINMISGSARPTSGEIIFQNQHLEKLPADRIARLGVARTFQNLRLFGKLTVLENVVIAEQMRNSYNFVQMALGTPHYRKSESRMREKAQVILQQLNLDRYAESEAGSLPYGYQRRLEIARCLALKPQLLLLDEPAAGMNPNESLQLVEDIRRIHEENGMTILLIEHDMKVIMNLCEYIYAMASGVVIGEGDPQTIRHDPEVIRAYLGEERKNA